MYTVNKLTSGREWRDALALVTNYDFYHTWDLHVIAQKNGEGDPHLYRIDQQGNGLLVPLLARTIPGTDYEDLTSVYGYPSPLVYGGISGHEILKMWKKLCQYLASNGYVSLFCRLHPLFSPEEIIGFHGHYCGPVVIIDLTLSEDVQVQQYRNAHKRNICKLKKQGVECRYANDEDSLQCFIDNYEATMRSLGALTKYFFTKKYYQRLLESTDFDARIYYCKYNDITICSGIFIFCRDVVQYHLGGTNPEFYKLAPTKLMFDKVRIDACKEGRKYFVLGGGLGAAEDNLFKFKYGFSKKTKDFYIIKLILNQSVYNDISSFRRNELNFFPKYRA